MSLTPIILGIDFTSAPGPRKAIAVARCCIAGGTMRVGDICMLRDFAALEALLREPGPWVAGCDFPFGLPRSFLEAAGWPLDWAAMVCHVEVIGKQAFEYAIRDYAARQEPGRKEPLRATDRLADSRSPLKLVNPPVAKMFREGAHRLLNAGVSILPCHRVDGESRIAVESYPALAARHWVGRSSYKSDDPRKQTSDRRAARAAIVEGITNQSAAESHGASVELSCSQQSTLIDDGSGDRLDAVLCALQAAGCWLRNKDGLGIPANADRLEGWIATLPPV